MSLRVGFGVSVDFRMYLLFTCMLTIAINENQTKLFQIEATEEEVNI